MKKQRVFDSSIETLLDQIEVIKMAGNTDLLWKDLADYRLARECLKILDGAEIVDDPNGDPHLDAKTEDEICYLLFKARKEKGK